MTARPPADIAHELNNVFTVILGGLALAERHAGGNAALVHLLETMRQGGERGAALVREMMPPEQHAVPEQPSGDPATPADQTRRILVVEDDPDVAEVALAVLEGLGHQVDLASNASAALARVAGSTDYDLVFSDIVMPGDMDGIGLAETLLLSHPNLPILLATGFSQAALGPASRRFPVMAKPYSVRELASRVTLMLAAAG